MAQNAVVIDEKIRIPADVFDLDGFRRWAHSDSFPQMGSISFLAGEVDVDMSPEDIETHNKVKGDLYIDLGTRIREHDLGELLPDGALLVNEAADVSTEPDMMFCSWEALDSGRASYREFVEDSNRFVEVSGGPDLIVEVVSATSIRKDTVILLQRYFAAGVYEYWLVDARGTEVDFKLFRRGGDRFEITPANPDGFLHSQVLQAEVKIMRQRNRRGTFRHSVEFRPTS